MPRDVHDNVPVKLPPHQLRLSRVLCTLQARPADTFQSTAFNEKKSIEPLGVPSGSERGGVVLPLPSSARNNGAEIRPHYGSLREVPRMPVYRRASSHRGVVARSSARAISLLGATLIAVVSADAQSSATSRARSPAATRRLTGPEIVRAVRPSVLFLRALDAKGALLSTGSGWIAPDGRVVTNAHVVEGAARMEALDADGETVGLWASAEFVSLEDDLAVLSRPTIRRPALRVSSVDVQDGERLFVFGAPRGFQNTVTNGVVSARRHVDGTELVQMSAPVTFGSSGGPVVNEAGAVVAVTVAGFPDSPGLNFAVALPRLKAALGTPPQLLSFPPERREVADVVAAEAAPKGVEVPEARTGAAVSTAPVSTNRGPRSRVTGIATSGGTRASAGPGAVSAGLALLMATPFEVRGSWSFYRKPKPVGLDRTGARIEIAIRDTVLGSNGSAVVVRVDQRWLWKDWPRESTKAQASGTILATGAGMLPISGAGEFFEEKPLVRDERTRFTYTATDDAVTVGVDNRDGYIGTQKLEMPGYYWFDGRSLVALAIAYGRSIQGSETLKVFYGAALLDARVSRLLEPSAKCPHSGPITAISIEVSDLPLLRMQVVLDSATGEPLCLIPNDGKVVLREKK